MNEPSKSTKHIYTFIWVLQMTSLSTLKFNDDDDGDDNKL